MIFKGKKMEKKSVMLILYFNENIKWNVDWRSLKKFGFSNKIEKNGYTICASSDELKLIKFSNQFFLIQSLIIPSLNSFFEEGYFKFTSSFEPKVLEKLKGFKLVFVDFLGTRLLQTIQKDIRSYQRQEMNSDFIQSSITGKLFEIKGKKRLPQEFVCYEIPDRFNRRYVDPTWIYRISGDFLVKGQINETILNSDFKKISQRYEEIFKNYSGIKEAQNLYLLKNNKFYL